MNDGWVETSHGYRLAITEDYKAESMVTAIVLHGFQSSRRGGSATAVMDTLQEAGLNTLSLDFYARGESDGEFQDLTIAKAVENIEAMIAHVHARDPQQYIILIGSSFGGLIAQYVAAKNPGKVVLLILRAPVSDWQALWHDHLTAEELKNWSETGSHIATGYPGTKVTFGRAFLDDIQRQDIYEQIAPQIRVPTLIVHGDADEVVPLSQSQELKKHLVLSDLIVLPGADHRFSRSVDMEAYQYHIQNFLRKSRVI